MECVEVESGKKMEEERKFYSASLFFTKVPVAGFTTRIIGEKGME